MQLIDKITTKTAKIGVVGLGYVGLPLAVEKAKAGLDCYNWSLLAKRLLAKFESLI